MKRYYFDNKENLFRQEDSTAFNEAAVLFTGEISYSRELPEECFRYLDVALSESDFAFAPVSMGAGLFRDEDKSGFLGRMDEAGFDACLFDRKSAGKYAGDVNLSLVPNICRTVVVNDIRLGVVNASVKTHRDWNKSVLSQIDALKSTGAEFVILFCRTADAPDSEIIKQAAEHGADYIILKQSGTAGGYSRLKCERGRDVPVIDSVGDAVRIGSECASAIFKLKIMRDYDGRFEIEDEYIPCLFAPDLEGRENCPVPTRPFYNGRYTNDRTKAAAKKVRGNLGKNIRASAKIRPFMNKSGFTPQLSIQEICDVLGVGSDFYDGEFPIDKKVHSIVIRRMELTEKCVAVLDESVDEAKAEVIITEELVKKTRPILVIADRKIEGVPTLVIPSPSEAFITLSRHIRKMYDPFTVAVTGSVGKSTVTDMIKTVMGYKFNCPDIKGNYNTFRSVGFCVQKLNDRYNGYVQELHGGSPGAASLGSSIVMPDVAVITTIAEVHLEQLGNSIEDVKREKLGIMDHIQEGGSLVVNNDNEYLQNLDVPVNLVTYAAFNRNSDYYAEDIVEHEDRISFRIVCDEGRYDAVIFCRGVHNVCNAVGAFAVGRLAGIEPHRITSALSRYRTSGFRQNLIKKDGYKIFADCFNSAPESVKSALQSVSGITPARGGKRIAVLGDMRELAEMTEVRHREVGAMVAESCVDVLVTLGEMALDIADEAKKRGMEAYGFTDRTEMENRLKELMKPGDVLLFKASHGVELGESINNIFGRLQ